MDPQIFTNMFALTVPLLEKIIRPIIVYFALIVGLRLAGKRELAQINPFDLVVLLTLSNTVQNAIIGSDNSITGGLIGAATLLAVNFLVVQFVYKNDRIEEMVEGKEDVLMDHGVVDHKALDRDAISLTELTSAAHKQGFGSLEEVDRAVLEPEGGVSFLPKKPDPETTRHQELLARIESLSTQLATLQKMMNEK
jgi:uncharacterized membrane protein YcaP (DUF421 family)